MTESGEYAGQIRDRSFLDLWMRQRKCGEGRRRKTYANGTSEGSRMATGLTD